MTEHVDTATGLPVKYLDSTGNAGSVTQSTYPGSENNTGSATKGFVATHEKNTPVIITQQTAVTLGATGANTTMFNGFVVSQNMTGNVVVTGFANQAGAATSITWIAPTRGKYDFNDGINTAGSLTILCATVGDSGFCTALYSDLV